MNPVLFSDPAAFLREYWQKKPCLMRQAWPDFEPLLNGDDLAGLAGDEMAESRLVRGCFEAADWEVLHGPLDADIFSTLPEENWTLLVQDVEKHYAPVQSLLQQFSFIPSWRLDDLMISYAVQGGSVGPHVDQYDVFLLQAQGRRRWQIADSFEPELLAGCELNVLRHFEATQEWVLEPGDMLYLPPNVAHHGLALEPGMTWSIGARAPSGADLLQGFGEWLALSQDEGGRYRDPGLAATNRAGEISPQALQALRQLMLSKIDASADVNAYLATFLSRFRMSHEPQPPPVAVKPETIRSALSKGASLLRNPWTQLTWIETTDGAGLFACGKHYPCSVELAQSLCTGEQPRLSSAMLDHASIQTITRMINAGHFILQKDRPDHV